MTTHTAILDRRTSPRWARWLALGAVAAAVLFTVAWLVLGVVSPGFTMWGTTIAPYSPISAPISGLGLGPTGPYMNAAFIVNGVLLLAGVIGICLTLTGLSPAARWTCLIVLSLTPLGSIATGIFTLEAGPAHFISSMVGLAGPVLAFLVTGLLVRRMPDWRRLGTGLVGASGLTLVLVVAFFLTFTPTVDGAKTGVAGLTERLVIVEVLAWYAAMGWHAFRAADRSTAR